MLTKETLSASILASPRSPLRPNWLWILGLLFGLVDFRGSILGHPSTFPDLITLSVDDVLTLLARSHLCAMITHYVTQNFIGLTISVFSGEIPSRFAEDKKARFD
jgi:hypothetical protein